MVLVINIIAPETTLGFFRYPSLLRILRSCKVQPVDFFSVWKFSWLTCARERQRAVSYSSYSNHTVFSTVLCRGCRIFSHIHHCGRLCYDFSTGSLSSLLNHIHSFWLCRCWVKNKHENVHHSSVKIHQNKIIISFPHVSDQQNVISCWDKENSVPL